MARAPANPGEYRLPACICRQPCRQRLDLAFRQSCDLNNRSRQAAETYRLAACAPRNWGLGGLLRGRVDGYDPGRQWLGRALLEPALCHETNHGVSAREIFNRLAKIIVSIF